MFCRPLFWGGIMADGHKQRIACSKLREAEDAVREEVRE